MRSSAHVLTDTCSNLEQADSVWKELSSLSLSTMLKKKKKFAAFPFYDNFPELHTLGSTREAYKCFQFVNKHMAFPNNFPTLAFQSSIADKRRWFSSQSLSFTPIVVWHEKFSVGKIHEGTRGKTFSFLQIWTSFAVSHLVNFKALNAKVVCNKYLLRIIRRGEREKSVREDTKIFIFILFRWFSIVFCLKWNFHGQFIAAGRKVF